MVKNRRESLSDPMVEESACHYVQEETHEVEAEAARESEKINMMYGIPRELLDWLPGFSSDEIRKFKEMEARTRQAARPGEIEAVLPGKPKVVNIAEIYAARRRKSAATNAQRANSQR